MRKTLLAALVCVTALQSACLLLASDGALNVHLNLRDADSPLSESLQNEVDHAIKLAEKALAKIDAGKAKETREATALRLVRSQKADGTWDGNAEDSTRRALEVLRGL